MKSYNWPAADKNGRPFALPHSQELTPHAARVAMLMRNAEQELPETPCNPGPDTRLLRAKLIFEEAMETICALGVQVRVVIPDDIVQRESYDTSFAINEFVAESGEWGMCAHDFIVMDHFDLEEVVDGCADISVVTIGTLLACGCPDQPFLEEVDSANLRKFSPGGRKREDGKWLKPADWTPPDHKSTLEALGYSYRV